MRFAAWFLGALAGAHYMGRNEALIPRLSVSEPVRFRPTFFDDLQLWSVAMPRYGKCEGKVRHHTQGKAESAARSLNQRNPKGGFNGTLAEAYPCSYCAGWHVGHASPKAHQSQYRE